MLGEGVASQKCDCCRELQREFWALSARKAAIVSRIREKDLSIIEFRQRHESTEEATAELRHAHAEFADRLQETEQRLEDLREERLRAEQHYRHEASAWQDVYNNAKIEKASSKQALAESEVAMLESEALTEELQRVYKATALDLDDARAACAATEARVKQDSEIARQHAERVCRGEVEARAAAAQAAGEEQDLRSRLERSSEVLRLRNASLEATRRRNEELMAELSDWRQRADSAHRALGQLRVLRQEAEEAVEATPTAREEESADVLRARLRAREEQLLELRGECLHWRQFASVAGDR